MGRNGGETREFEIEVCMGEGGDGEDAEQQRGRHILMQGPRVRTLKSGDTRDPVNRARNARV
jgi:hypothetical protein